MDSSIVARHRRPGRLFAMCVALTLALAALASLAPATQAGTTPPIDFRILKINCPEDPGVFPEGEIPEGCTPVEGVAFTIDIEDGDTLTCTTNADGRCTVQVPSEANALVTEETIPDGYAPRENPIQTQAVTEFAGAVFVNLPEEPPTTGLPDTGAGVTAPANQSLAGLLAVVALVVLGAALSLRRPRQR